MAGFRVYGFDFRVSDIGFHNSGSGFRLMVQMQVSGFTSVNLGARHRNRYFSRSRWFNFLKFGSNLNQAIGLKLLLQI